MNVLLTSAGRRNYLVSYFQDVLAGQGHVFAADADPNAAALQVADKAFVAPKFNDEKYFEFLEDICRRHHVSLLLSLNDLELPLLARRRERLQAIGVTVVVS